MLSLSAIAEAPISAVRAVEGLPFGGLCRATATASGTPRLLRVSGGNALASSTALGSLRVFVVASGVAVATSLASGRPNFVIYAATREFITEPTDQIANQPLFGTLQPSIQFDRSIITDKGFGQATLGWGEIALINKDGGYDYLIQNYAADGRRLVLRVGAGDSYDGYYTVFNGVASGISVEEDVLRVFLRDATYKLDVPAQASTYDGTGDLDGTSDIASKRKPRAFGYCSNVPAVLVIPGLKLFQVNDGPVNAITAVYSRGAAVTYDTDYATTAALKAATIPSGKYATCLAAGIFRVNFVLEGDITADVQGDKTGGTFVSSTADIIQRLVTSAPGVAASDLDLASFARVNAAQGEPISLYLDTSSNLSIADVVSDLMGPLMGWGGFRRDGKFEVGLFRPSDSVVPSARYSEIDIIAIDRGQLPAGLDPQPYRYRVAWGRNWYGAQTDLAGSVVDPDRINFLSQEYRLEPSSAADMAAIRIDHPRAQDAEPVLAHFRDKSAAGALAQLLLNMFGLRAMAPYTITLQNRQFVHEIGDLIHVTYDRWDLKAGRLLNVVSVSEKVETRQTIVVAVG